MSRVFNFSAGPAMLPESVMMQVRDELMSWHDLGASVMEISHRSKDFIAVADAAEASLRSALAIPEAYRVLFMHGGAQGQFSAIPMNILGDQRSAAYVKTGLWGTLAADEAQRFCQVNVIADASDRHYTYIPDWQSWANCENDAYLHYVDNETVHGVEFAIPPPNVPISVVADMSSNLLTRPIDFANFDLIYACAQKNLGPAGITVVIVHDRLLSRQPHPAIPRIFDYRLQSEKASMVNTPPTFPWYMVGLVTDWVLSQGGVAVMDNNAKKRSQPIYDYIDQTDFYYNRVASNVRSRINVVFFLKTQSLAETFLKEALAAGLYGLKGHRALGGVRASMYNAMPQQGADLLLAFMKDFEQRYG